MAMVIREVRSIRFGSDTEKSRVRLVYQPDYGRQRRTLVSTGPRSGMFLGNMGKSKYA